MGIKIEALGVYVPQSIITNDDLAKVVDTSDEWITTRTGIKQRHITKNELAYTLGAKACEKAFAQTSLTPDDIDFVIVTSITHDFYTPSLSCMIANEVGIKSAPCMDLNCACTGFIYALDVAQKYLRDGDAKHVLIVSAENLTKITDFTDRSSCVLFGDGAAACIVSNSNSKYTAYLASDPTGGKHLFAKNSANKSPFSKDSMDWREDYYKDAKDGVLKMDGQEVYKFATSAMPEAVNKVLQKANMSTEDVDMVIPHQANIRIVQTAVKKLKMKHDKFYVNIQNYGNTSSASIPIALEEAIANEKIKRGDKVCLVGFGAGLTYGAIIFEY